MSYHSSTMKPIMASEGGDDDEQDGPGKSYRQEVPPSRLFACSRMTRQQNAGSQRRDRATSLESVSRPRCGSPRSFGLPPGLDPADRASRPASPAQGKRPWLAAHRSCSATGPCGPAPLAAAESAPAHARLLFDLKSSIPGPRERMQWPPPCAHMTEPACRANLNISAR